MFGLVTLCRPFGDLSLWCVWLCCHVWLCRPFGDPYEGPLVTLAVNGDLSCVWLCYVGPLVTLAVFGMFGYAM